MRSAVRVEDRIWLYAAGVDGGLECVGDETGAHVVGHREADDHLGVAVDHRRQVHPAFPGADVGDVADEFHAWLGGGEVPADQVEGTGGPVGVGRGPVWPGLAGDHVVLDHDLADQFQPGLNPVAGQLGMDPPVTVGLVEGVEDLPDLRFEVGASLGGRSPPTNTSW